MITAEGAIWHGAQMADWARRTPSATGTRPTSARRWRPRSRERTGIETLASELTYDLRSGEPDSVDSMVATTFANVAMDLVEGGRDRADGRDPGRQVRPHARCPTRRSGRARSTSPVMYNAARFRPRYDGKLGDPMLLVGLD